MARLTCTSCEVTASRPTQSVVVSSRATALASASLQGGPPQQVEATHESPTAVLRPSPPRRPEPCHQEEANTASGPSSASDPAGRTATQHAKPTHPTPTRIPRDAYGLRRE